jgi:hypothetical protein
LKRPAQKKQIARLHRFRAGAEWLRRRAERDAKFFQVLLALTDRQPSPVTICQPAHQRPCAAPSPIT